jgi:transcriptional regulator with PAS, ATPase and Fis domain
MNVQKTLLRFLQEKEFNRLGDTSPTRVDVRVLSATNSDLKLAVKEGSFREDLYYRLNVVNIHLPPLRERRDDIPLLAAHFIHLQNQKFGTTVKGFDKEAVQALCDFDWPGNIRQLKNVIEACMAMEGHDFITRDTLIQFIEVHGGAGEALALNPAASGDVPFNAALDRFEADLLRGLLKKHAGNIENAAREADMNMATIYRKIKKYGIRKEEYC